MAGKHNKQSHKLLSSLQSLYKKLATAVLDFRKNTYKYVGATGKTSNIKSIINTQIDELVSNHEKADAKKASNNSDLPKKNSVTSNDNKTIEANNYQAGKSIENEFSKYLKMENLTSVTQPGIVTKLTESTWEHIHAALRMARHGDADKARLHLDIADQALNEVCHYMNSDDFSMLVNNVEQYLHKLQE